MRGVDEELDQALAGNRVIVESANGQRFEGILALFDPVQRHVLIRDVQEHPGGASFPLAFVPDVAWIVGLAPDEE